MAFVLQDVINEIEETRSLDPIKNFKKKNLVEVAVHFGITPAVGATKSHILDLIENYCIDNDIIDEVEEKPIAETAEIVRLKLDFEREERRLAREEAREEAQKARDAEKAAREEARELRLAELKEVPKPRDSQAVKSAATILVPDAGSENKADGDGFRYPSHVIRRQRRQAVYGNRARGVAGSFRGAPQTLDIFVFRCEKDVTCEKVKDYIEQNNINVLDIECISSSEARYRSFRVTLPKHARDDVMECNFWPDGVGVRVFRKKRTQFADNNSQDGG